MPVRFVKKSQKKKPEPEVKEEPKGKKQLFKPKGSEVKKGPEVKPGLVAGFQIYPDMDLRIEKDKVKFLIHRTKPNVWYVVDGFDEFNEGKNITLKSPSGQKFDSHMGITTKENYVLVSGPVGAKQPPEAVIKHIASKG